MSNKISEKEIKAIMKNNLIDFVKKDIKDIVFQYAFGSEFIKSKNKGAIREYEEL